MIRLVLIRHAPLLPRDGAIYGASDVPADLTDTDAIRALALRLPRRARWLTSPALRARQTAEALIACLPGVAPDGLHVEASLREQDFGAWEGMRWDEIAPEKTQAFWCDPVESAPPGGESYAALFARVKSWIERFSASPAPDGEPFAIAVCHAGAIRAARAILSGAGARESLGWAVEPLTAHFLPLHRTDSP